MIINIDSNKWDQPLTHSLERSTIKSIQLMRSTIRPITTQPPSLSFEEVWGLISLGSRTYMFQLMMCNYINCSLIRWYIIILNWSNNIWWMIPWSDDTWSPSYWSNDSWSSFYQSDDSWSSFGIIFDRLSSLGWYLIIFLHTRWCLITIWRIKWFLIII